MFGITPMPIYDPKQQISYMREFMIFFRPGDIVAFKPVDRDGYDAAVEAVDQGRYQPRIRPVSFDLDAFRQSPDATSQATVETLHGH